MLTKICRATSALRGARSLENTKYVQMPMNYIQHNLHCSAKSSQISAHVQCCISQASAPSLFTKQTRIAIWVFQRFQTHSSHASKDLSGIHENITALHTKPRTQRWRNNQKRTEKGYPIAAFSTAEEFDLERLKVAIAKQELYSVVQDEEVFKVQESKHQGEDVVHIKALYNVEDEPREVFFFREGTAIFWNVSDLEISNFLRFLKPFEENSYDEKLVMTEKEVMSYVHGDGKKTALRNDVIELAIPASSSLEKYSFSNGIALSVKLGIWEASLQKFIDSIEFMSEDLKAGRKICMTREEVLRKQGELFALRHLINLSSDLLDTPDFYWDNEELEKLYMQTYNYFCISRRTRVMNEKINHCAELVELVASHLSDKHHVRLEWMIIVLIMVEVAFEFLHYMGS